MKRQSTLNRRRQVQLKPDALASILKEGGRITLTLTQDTASDDNGSIAVSWEAQSGDGTIVDILDDVSVGVGSTSLEIKIFSNVRFGDEVTVISDGADYTDGKVVVKDGTDSDSDDSDQQGEADDDDGTSQNTLGGGDSPVGGDGGFGTSPLE